VIDRIPLDALLARLGSSRSAVFKTMFDAQAYAQRRAGC